jgi:hypothetical protein
MIHRENSVRRADASVPAVRSIHTCLLGVVWAALFFELLSGCGPTDECSAAQAYCDGDVAMNCEWIETGNGTASRWQSGTCSANSCKLSSIGFAFCSASPNPDPRCARRLGDICDGNIMRECVDGYATAPGTVCGAFCNQFDADAAMDREVAGAECVDVAERNPNCPSTPDMSGACDGNDLLLCENGFVAMRQPCGTGFCVGIEQCALSKDPDPNCLPSEAQMSVCDGNIAVQCAYGYRISERPCAAGESCMTMPVPRACSNANDASCNALAGCYAR